MKRIQFLCVAVVLLLTNTVTAGLMVQEYVSGQKVTLDTTTGNYWYWNLADFINKTYAEQITAIAGLGTYGNIAGGWHMATKSEMQALWANGAAEVTGSFNPNYISTISTNFKGRYEEAVTIGGSVPGHELGLAQITSGYPSGVLWPLPQAMLSDATSEIYTSAWVVSDHAVVPVPGALLLAATGLLSSTLGLKRLHRKR